MALGLSPDGKKVAMAGAGCWRAKTARVGLFYDITVFDTSDLMTSLGQISLGKHCMNIAFHPTHNQGIAARGQVKRELVVFNSKSFATKNVCKSPDCVGPGYLHYSGQGSKVSHVVQPPGGSEQGSTVAIFKLDLSDDERETLKKAFAR